MEPASRRQRIRAAGVSPAPLALAVLLVACGAQGEAPRDAAPDGGARPDAGSPPADGAVADAPMTPPECALGTYRYDLDGGACLPADPCFPDDPCAPAHRICTNDRGVARCGRCLDGAEPPAPPAEPGTGACVPVALETYAGRFTVGRDHFRVWDGARYRHLFVRGVNLGATPPGQLPGTLGVTADQYARWLDTMREGGVNAVRLYTLHPPRFYDALAAHNRAHPDAPIFLFQGVWLREPAPGPEPTTASRDLAITGAPLDGDVIDAIDCVHGARTLAPRPGRPDGTYASDVSEWTLGWIVGREVGHEEVMATDAGHPEWTSFEGETMRIAAGSPSEVWIAERLDRAVAYETRTYGESRPIGFSSWMELDPVRHPTEGSRSGKDVASVDLGRIEPFAAPAGHFVSYHVYPYYPDFVSEDPRYRAYADELGRDAYRGVLRALREHHQDVALLVAEYGVPSSWGRAHTSASGMHHGGLSEEEVGTYAARMLRDIDAVGLAGGIYFQWTDGWWKPIWITRERAFPADRYAIWHDLMNAQQHYGMLAFDPITPPLETLAARDDGRVRAIAWTADAEALHLRIALDPGAPLADGETITLGLDTYADDRGETLLPDGARTSLRSELALTITAPDRAELRVMRAYDLLALQIPAPPGEVPMRSIASDEGAWTEMRWVIAAAHGSDDGSYVFPDELRTIGTLRARREGTIPPSSLDAVVIDAAGGAIDVRLPWLLLQLADPSAREAFDDDPATDGVREVTRTEGVAIAVSIGGTLLLETPRASWPTWDVAPPTTERLKAGAETFFEALRARPRWLD